MVKKVKTAAAPKVKVPGVGDVAIEALRAGKDNDETLAIVKKKFPKADVSMSCVAWYRNKLRSDGESKTVLTAREIKKRRKAAAKK